MQHTKKYRFDLIERDDVFAPDALNGNMEKVEGALEREAVARAAADAAEARALGADVLTGTGDRMGFLSLLERAVRERTPERGGPLEAVDPPFERRQCEGLPAGGLEGRTRALLKVEDGCVNFCSYCIIPYARGPVRSLRLGEAAVQALELKNQGYQEIVLTGIEISSWGRDLPGKPTLIALLEALSSAAPGVSAIHPTDMEITRIFSPSGKVSFREISRSTSSA